MPIVVVGGIKGGSGKSTLATNLVVCRAQQGRKVLLIDVDEQRSASDWAEHRDTLGIPSPWTTISLLGASIRTQILKLKDSYDDIILDAGGRDTISQRSALIVADIFIAPFQPRSLDIWTVGKLSDLLKEIRTVNPQLKAWSVLNRSDAQGTDNIAAADILKDCSGITLFNGTIGQRKAFSNASSEGLGVIELKRQDPKATAEIWQLCKELFQ